MKIALAGNPNSGKTTIFNLLTGLNQKVANFPGVTVDKKIGKCLLANNMEHPPFGRTEVDIIDLPGAYSLNPKTIDEQITHQIICDTKNADYPDLTVIVADATNLKRNLFFATQIIDLGKPCVLVLNMMDEVENQKIEINGSALSEMLGIAVVPVSARKNTGIENLKKILSSNISPPTKSITRELTNSTTNSQPEETIARYKKISEIIKQCVQQPTEPVAETFTNKLDNIFTHKFFGFIVFLAILFLIFQCVFTFAAYPMKFIEWAFVQCSVWLSSVLPTGILSDLIVNGIVAGLSGIVVFVPQIAFLFAFIAILEDTGYMARVSFMFDKLMRKFGLNGRSVIPLISGAACAIPAIMATRTIGNWKERMITILVIPLMSCSARIPVYTLLISMVVPDDKLFGIFNEQGLVLMALYVIGFVAAIGSAMVFKYLLKSKERSFFVMEMPVYRSPRWASVGLIIYEKVKVFLFEAGKIIIAVSIILWALSSFGPNSPTPDPSPKGRGISTQPSSLISSPSGRSGGASLENSYAGIIGKSIEPAIAPLGFDWKIGIALITSFAAREVFVGTMATIYSVENPDNSISIREKMINEINPKTGEKLYSRAVGFSLMLFYAFALQCMSTIAIVYRETKHWKWAALQFVYMSALAYCASFLVYQIMK